jgi:predicted O-methyltransferase YrrM
MKGLDYIKEGDVCCEVGVWKGDMAKLILQKNPSELHLVDPWMSQPIEGRMYNISQKRMDVIANEVAETFDNDDRVYIHRDFSENVEFKEDSFDWVYIDGNHNYKEVLQDLRNYWKYTKHGGVIVGDDLDFSGVEQALTEFEEEKDFVASIIDGKRFAFQVLKEKEEKEEKEDVA